MNTFTIKYGKREWFADNWPLLLLAALILLTIFCITDCSCGTVKHWECQVFEHRYVEPRTEVRTTVDENGTHVDVIHHPEEFHLYCIGELEVDVQVDSERYHRLINGTEVTVRTKIGKWTGIKWVPHIVE